MVDSDPKRRGDLHYAFHAYPQQVLQGPLTRARARQLNYQVNSFLCLYITENKPLPKASDLIVLSMKSKNVPNGVRIKKLRLF